MLKDLETKLIKWLQSNFVTDVAHDLLHIKRVVASCKKIAEVEGGNLAVIVPAAYLHDCVSIPKDSAERNRASTLSAQRATDLLTTWEYDEVLLSEIYHVIESHSFSANIKANTLEARILQDADRLDSVGAIGIARCFSIGGAMGRGIYSEVDPFCDIREPNDSENNVDHFFVKLFKLSGMMNTLEGKKMMEDRVKFMEDFLNQLRVEIR